MILERSMHPEWLSNTYLVADQPGGHGVLIDTGAPIQPILQKIEEHRITLTHILCTHHHWDHIENNEAYKQKYACPVCAGKPERDFFSGLDIELGDQDELVSGGLHIRALHIPGHTVGQLGFVINDAMVFTGDTLFRGSVGGTRAPGHTSFEDLQHSILEVLMRLPPAMAVYPGHTEATTIQRESQENPFIRMWRKLDAPAPKPCLAFGQPATLLLRAQDYDGGTKCQVRFEEGNQLDIVPGSRVVDA